MSNPYSIFDRAERKRSLSRFLEAIPLYLEAQRLAGVDEDLKSACFFSLGDTYRMVGDFTRAGRCYAQSRKILLAMGDDMRALDAMVGLGLSLRATGEVRESLALFNRALKTYEKFNDRAGIAFTLWARAGALRLKGDLKAAIEGFRGAKKGFSGLKDRSGVGYCLTGLGGTSRVLGRYDDSRKYYTEANRLFTRLKDTFGVAYSYCGIANSMRMTGDFKGSLRFFNKAKTNYRRIGDKVSYAYTLWGEGTAQQMLGKDKEALKDFKEAERLFKETRDRRGLIYCALSIGEFDCGRDLKKGTRAFSAALKKAQALGLGVEASYAKRLIDAAKKDPGKIPMNLA